MTSSITPNLTDSVWNWLTRHDSANDLRRASIQALALIVLVITVATGAIGALLGHFDRPLLALAIHVVAALVVFGLARLTGHLAIASHIATFAVAVTLLLADGASDQVSLGAIWLGFIPLWTGLTVGIRAMWAWTAAAIAVAIAISIRADAAHPIWTRPVSLIHVIAFVIAMAALVAMLIWYTKRREQALKAAEQAARDAERMARDAEQHKTRLLATMSHELRSPLMGILASAEVIMGADNNPAAASSLSTLNRSADSLVRILDSVLDLAKIESGSMVVEQERFAVRPMIESVVSLCSDQALANDSRLILQIDPALAGEWVGDGAKVRQIIVNLVSSACRRTQAGEIVVRVEPGRDRQLLISVSDTGTGFSAADLEIIFDPFAPRESDQTEAWNATGLGLSISQDMASVIGSEIEVESNAGGTKFSFESCTKVDGSLSVGATTDGPRSIGTVRVHTESQAALDRTLPWLAHWGIEVAEDDPASTDPRPFELELDDRSAHTEEWADVHVSELARIVDAAFGVIRQPLHVAPVVSPETSGSGSEIAIVDDSSNVREAVAAMVESVGHTALTFSSGQDLLSWPGLGRVAAIFLDLSMPSLDGMQVLEQLRARPSTSEIPVCILSGSDSRAEKALDVGARTFLLKPVRLQTLRAVLDELLTSADEAPST